MSGVQVCNDWCSDVDLVNDGTPAIGGSQLTGVKVGAVAAEVGLSYVQFSEKHIYDFRAAMHARTQC